ncbi:MAG: HNH endonuclease [Allorhizobium sp.]
MARKNRDDFASPDETALPPVICPLCARDIPEDQQEAHHLVPKSKGGKQTVILHRVCHDQIHAVFSDAQLAKKFSTIEAILEDEAVQKFVGWIKTKPPGFADSARDAQGSFRRGRK